MNNGESIIISIPPLTEERRIELVKVAKSEVENAKVSIRNARKEANNEIRKSDASEDMKSNFEIDIQNITDKYTSKIDCVHPCRLFGRLIGHRFLSPNLSVRMRVTATHDLALVLENLNVINALHRPKLGVL